MTNSLFDAAHNGNVAEIKTHLSTKFESLNDEVSDGFTLLHIAAAFGQEELVAFLLDRGALVNKNANNKAGETALHLAVLYRDEETAARVADRLIANGAELNAPQKGGQTALHHAVARGAKSIVETLIQAGADPMLKDQNGLSPMQLANFDEPIKAVLRQSTKLV
jgi:ankyrin repeat protein